MGCSRATAGLGITSGLSSSAETAFLRWKRRRVSASDATTPYVVFGISLLLLFHTLGVPRSLLTVVIGHIVITLPLILPAIVSACRIAFTTSSYSGRPGRPRPTW